MHMHCFKLRHWVQYAVYYGKVTYCPIFEHAMMFGLCGATKQRRFKSMSHWDFVPSFDLNNWLLIVNLETKSEGRSVQWLEFWLQEGRPDCKNIPSRRGGGGGYREGYNAALSSFEKCYFDWFWYHCIHLLTDCPFRVLRYTMGGSPLIVTLSVYHIPVDLHSPVYHVYSDM